MELLERDGALATLAEARDEAARGDGRVVVVTGEAGIGKTSLVDRLVRELGPGARVLLGTCDDLSIPRPLGPLHDLTVTVSAPLEEALSGGALRTRSTVCSSRSRGSRRRRGCWCSRTSTRACAYLSEAR